MSGPGPKAPTEAKSKVLSLPESIFYRNHLTWSALKLNTFFFSLSCVFQAGSISTIPLLDR